VTTLFFEEMPSDVGPQWKLVADRLELLKEDAVYGLSIDLDAFPQSDAPGVSAPQTVGLNPLFGLEFVRKLKPQARQLGIYELNPRFDVDARTARLAARLVWEFFF
jgi:formiminoglutamase